MVSDWILNGGWTFCLTGTAFHSFQMTNGPHQITSKLTPHSKGTVVITTVYIILRHGLLKNSRLLAAQSANLCLISNSVPSPLPAQPSVRSGEGREFFAIWTVKVQSLHST